MAREHLRQFGLICSDVQSTNPSGPLRLTGDIWNPTDMCRSFPDVSGVSLGGTTGSPTQRQILYVSVWLQYFSARLQPQRTLVGRATVKTLLMVAAFRPLRRVPSTLWCSGWKEILNGTCCLLPCSAKTWILQLVTWEGLQARSCQGGTTATLARDHR